MPYQMHYDITRFGELDIYLFKEGTHTKAYELLGSHIMQRKGIDGVYFALWAPNAINVTIRGDFNSYDIHSHPLKMREDGSGIWEGFVENIAQGSTYKYHILTGKTNYNPDKSDPYAFFAEEAPNSASRVWNIDDYEWKDSEWMKKRGEKNSHKAPVAIYEMHMGSWRRQVEEGNRFLSYKEAADELSSYLKEMNYTHVELLPITEHPFEGSWGYQVSGYYAPTSRYGTPQEFMYFVDTMHKNGIGVILDWVPSHFVSDGHGLMNFDGTCLYEHEDPRLGYHPEWNSAIFNYGRNEVRAFLISSAMFWLDKYHIDGIRVDAVASMLYLNYAREEGEWVPNRYGGNENLEAIAFLRQLNTSVYKDFKDIMMFAEESTAFPGVTKSVSEEGLGFGFKWNMGWMHDTLRYMKKDPVHRQHHHHELTFSFVYMYDENYTLPLSHDEVVHMKGSLINKMPGDDNQKFANIRAMYAYMYAHPGKKLLFMGGEFAQFAEWNYKQSLDWHLLDYPLHKGLKRMISSLNKLYREEEALHTKDNEADGCEWIDNNDYEANVITFVRKAGKGKRPVIIICNFSDHTRKDYPIGLPSKGKYKEIFNSQSREFEGWGIGNEGLMSSKPDMHHGRENMLHVTLPPLGVIYLKKVD